MNPKDFKETAFTSIRSEEPANCASALPHSADGQSNRPAQLVPRIKARSAGFAVHHWLGPDCDCCEATDGFSGVGKHLTGAVPRERLHPRRVLSTQTKPGPRTSAKRVFAKVRPWTACDASSSGTGTGTTIEGAVVKPGDGGRSGLDDLAAPTGARMLDEPAFTDEAKIMDSACKPGPVRLAA